MTRKRYARATGDTDSVRPGVSDAPTGDDRLRIRKARRQTRAWYAEVEEVREAEAAQVFRAELCAVLRSASPLLISLLSSEGRTLDDAVALIQPARFWPRRATSSDLSCEYSIRNSLWRHYVKTTPVGCQSQPPRHAYTFHSANGDYLRIQVVAHSLELEAKMARVWLETPFGELCVQLDEALPETVAAACVGRMIEEIVDHRAWRGRGWRIIEVEDAVAPYFGQPLVVAAGSVPYRITWPQSAVSDNL